MGEESSIKRSLFKICFDEGKIAWDDLIFNAVHVYLSSEQLTNGIQLY